MLLFFALNSIDGAAFPNAKLLPERPPLNAQPSGGFIPLLNPSIKGFWVVFEKYGDVLTSIL
jgi:hypothetical protein